MAEKKINIIDVTVRKGGFLVHNQLLQEQVADIAKGLEEAGVEFMELTHGRGLGAKRIGYPALFSDQELLKAARKAAPKIKFTAFLSPYPYSLFEVDGVKDLYEYFRLSVDFDEVDKAIENLKNVRDTGVKTMVLLERAHRVSSQECSDTAKRFGDAGVEAIYLCDNFSSMTADDVRAYLGAMQDSKRPLGFQAYNATSRAVGNTLAALEAGAEWIDGSLLGLGPSGGMAPLEILAALLPRLGYSKQMNLLQLTRAGRWYALPAVRKLPRIQLIDLIMARLKLDYYPLELFDRLSEILEMDVEAMLEEINAQDPKRIRLKEADIRIFLENHQLDFNVVMEFIKTGKVPGIEVAS